MNHEFTIKFSLEDYRDKPVVDTDVTELRYRAVIKEESSPMSSVVMSQWLRESDLGTRRSFVYMMDGIREQLLRRLCPNEPPPIPPTK
jgi:hypothetical protein